MAELLSNTDFTTRTGCAVASVPQYEMIEAEAAALVAGLVGDSTVTDSWDTTTVPAAVRGVVAKMVARELAAPGMPQPQQESQQGYAYSLSADALSGVYATPREARIVRRAAGVPVISAVLLSVEPLASWGREEYVL